MARKTKEEQIKYIYQKRAERARQAKLEHAIKHGLVQNANR